MSGFFVYTKRKVKSAKTKRPIKKKPHYFAKNKGFVSVYICQDHKSLQNNDLRHQPTFSVVNSR